MKKWLVSRPDPAKVRRINAETDLGPLLSEIMAGRGYDSTDRLVEFFNGGSLSDPFLMADMEKAAEVISEEVESGGIIAIFGDYDCDGISSTAILYDYLSSMGAEVICRIPEREEGYGLNKAAVDELKEAGADLIITVDNGISAIEEAEYIKSLGLKLVVTDHHQPTETLPDALAVVDPHRSDCLSPFKQLCGAGVVLKLCAALDGGSYDSVCEQYLDLAAIATVADVVPLVGENRFIVREGLRLLKNTENLGLLALMEECGVSPENMTSTLIAFTLAPRINAASRFGSPKTALDMLLSEDGSAPEYAKKLVSLNAMRKAAESGIMDEISAMIDSSPKILSGRVLKVAGKGWHRGVIGIVAARLCETYEKPAVVFSIGEDGLACGSARSVAGFNIFKCFDSCRELLVKYGGHELAGGLTAKEEDLTAVYEQIEKYAAENFEKMPEQILNADRLLKAGDLTTANAASLGRLEPFGAGNPEPLFAISGARIDAVYPLKGGEHTKLEISFDGVKVPVLMFRTKTAEFNYSAGDEIDLMANMSLNEYKGNKSVSLRAADIRLHGIRQDAYFAANDAYLRFRRGENSAPGILQKGNPDRSELIEVYKFLAGADGISFENLYARLDQRRFNAFKLRIIIDAFGDAGLVNFSPSTGKIKLLKPTARADLDGSETLKALRAMI